MSILRTKDGHHAIIDDRDISWLSQYKWAVHKTQWPYVYGKIDGKKVYLHRLIMSAAKGQMVDHINRNPLDNRRCNLRFCSARQNVLNCDRKPPKSGHVGVYWDKTKNKWRVQVYKNNKPIWIGCFRDKNEAVSARLRAEIENYGTLLPRPAS